MHVARSGGQRKKFNCALGSPTSRLVQMSRAMRTTLPLPVGQVVGDGAGGGPEIESSIIEIKIFKNMVSTDLRVIKPQSKVFSKLLKPIALGCLCCRAIWLACAAYRGAVE